MKFVEKHLTKHHLFHAPHRWFFAFLSSPIYFVEMHYKKKYHLTFKHAKKLFVFDMALLLGAVTLLGSSLFFFVYDPTITDLVHIQITGPTERIKSGEVAQYRVFYKNNSEVVIQDITLSFETPEGFVLYEAESNISQEELLSGKRIERLAPGSQGETTFSGRFFGVPDEQYIVAAHISYTQEQRNTSELVARKNIAIVRDSVLEFALELPKIMLGNGQSSMNLTLKNTSDQEISNVEVPFTIPVGTQVTSVEVDSGSISGSTWAIERIAAGETLLAKVQLLTTLSNTTENILFELTPNITVNNTTFTQEPSKKSVQVVHPSVDLNVDSVEKQAPLTPGESRETTVSIQNTSNATITNLELRFPIDASINKSALQQKNSGTIVQHQFVIQKTHNLGLAELLPGQRVEIPITLPTLRRLSAAQENPSLLFQPELIAQVQGVQDGRYQKKSSTSLTIPMSSALFLQAKSLYYTPEGDQLGRGPLPPQVGKQSKYWALIGIQNTSNRVGSVVFTATLAPGVEWTNRSSVSDGAPLQYNEQNRTIRWTISNIYPGQEIGINAELGITPSLNQVGFHAPLLTNISIQGTDRFTEQTLSASAQSIDTSLPEDLIGQNRGTTVISPF